MEEEEVQTAAGLTLRGQRLWETAGQYEDERSMPRLDKPGSHWLMDWWVKVGGGKCKEIKIKSYKVEQRQRWASQA